MPAISLPCGFDRRGLPIGLQIAARPYDEACCCARAASYEAAHDWKERDRRTDTITVAAIQMEPLIGQVGRHVLDPARCSSEGLRGIQLAC